MRVAVLWALLFLTAACVAVGFAAAVADRGWAAFGAGLAAFACCAAQTAAYACGWADD